MSRLLRVRPRQAARGILLTGRSPPSPIFAGVGFDCSEQLWCLYYGGYCFWTVEVAHARTLAATQLVALLVCFCVDGRREAASLPETSRILGGSLLPEISRILR